MFRLLCSVGLFLGLLSSFGCGESPERPIALGGAEPPAEATALSGEAKVRFAIGGMITPKAGLAYYRDLLRYVQSKIGVKIELVDRESYAEINGMLETGKLDAAFVCSGPYVDGRKKFGLELLAAPQAYGDTVYYSYIIVPRDSPLKSFADLRGLRFAFTDPLSNTGRTVPVYMLSKMGETPENFFRETVFTKSHDKSIRAVAYGMVDGAAVDSLIWEYMNSTDPEFTSRTRVLEKSPPYAIPPVVVAAPLAPDLKSSLSLAFLNAHLDPEGLAILRRMRIDRFVVLDDRAYDSVREMKEWIDKGAGR